MRAKEIRIIEAYPHSWGPGKVHAATYGKHWMWGRTWLVICTQDGRVHGKEPTKIKRSELASVVTCKRCLLKLKSLAAHTVPARRPSQTVTGTRDLGAG